MIRYIRVCLFYIVTLLPTSLLFGHVRLPAIVSDSMILQRDVKLKVWGWASADEMIKVVFKGHTYKTNTGNDGKWLVLLSPAKAGGPYSMTITGKDNSIIIKNILIGDVWLCAGQSNMVHSLALHKDRYAGEIASANYTDIRQFLVPVSPALQGPSDNITGVQWKAATPSNIQRFSVVAYFFAKQLYKKYNIPIGIINTSVGGSPIEAWTSEAGLKEFPDVLRVLERNKDSSYVISVNARAAKASQALREQEQHDQGLSDNLPWYSALYNPQQWNAINIPGYWEDQGIQDLDGIVWYRKELDIPVSVTGQSKMCMGRIVNADEVYINGTRIGNTTYEYPQRRYTIPDGVLKTGKNVIAIRVLNQNGKGGFVPDKPYYVVTGKDTIDLTGEWHYKVGLVYRKPVTRINAIAIQNQPAALYNGMIAPFTNYAIKGVTWYQGESNTSKAEAYDRLLPALIRDWRNHWQQELPFLYAQLPNFMNVDYKPSESEWARLRDAQLKALQIPNTAMAVTIDLGEWNDIHPDNKKPIGDRLALAAQHVAYNDMNVVYSGPVYSKCSVDSNNVVLTFTNIGGGLISTDNEPLRWFSVAGDNKKFFWANAIIRNNQVIVSCKDVPDPMYVRYAWADNPDHVNFYNKEGLPATPFQAEVAALHTRWHGKKAAVVLTYDDALGVQLDNVIPLLDSLGIKATFYLSAASPDCKNRMADWKHAAANGHELGNHTWYHPCDGSKPGRSWVSSANDLSHYTTTQIVREIEMTNEFLQSLDGKRERTFAYTCGDMQTSEGSFVDTIRDQFVAMRGVNGALNKPESLDLTNVNCYVADESNADQLIVWADKAREEHALLVVLFHGVGGGHNINVDLKRHHALLNYLSAHPHDFWVTTMLDAAQHCTEMKKNAH